ncbi:MAG: YhbY family RNA-binding protein [Nitrosospira sp.]|nr:YhbY family RNA-binding protein [Nitrosospira sp.]
MLALTLARRRALTALAHAIKPVVQIGAAGLTENVIHELNQGLKSHELIKVKVFSDERGMRDVLLKEICQRLEAAPVQHIGKIFVIYRPKPDEIASSTAATFRKKRESRRTKRSFQA